MESKRLHRNASKKATSVTNGGLSKITTKSKSHKVPAEETPKAAD